MSACWQGNILIPLRNCIRLILQGVGMPGPEPGRHMGRGWGTPKMGLQALIRHILTTDNIKTLIHLTACFCTGGWVGEYAKETSPTYGDHGDYLHTLLGGWESEASVCEVQGYQLSQIKLNKTIYYLSKAKYVTALTGAVGFNNCFLIKTLCWSIGEAEIVEITLLLTMHDSFCVYLNINRIFVSGTFICAFSS